MSCLDGNHDARQLTVLAFSGIAMRDEAVHTLAEGRKCLVIHGDLYDTVVFYTR
ncbi:MAG: hypothetical protein GTO41_19110 [Burkholderiales bacterium]|nr:hypothetical protein [Burkholderiales bacterium]